MAKGERDVDEDNHYSLGKTEPDLLQCRVVVNLHGYGIKSTVYDVRGERTGSQNGRLENKNDWLTVKGLLSDLAVIYVDDTLQGRYSPGNLLGGAWHR